MSGPDQSRNTPPGERIGPFRIERELGLGAMGVVYVEPYPGIGAKTTIVPVERGFL